jgi:hypothetical protein
MGPADLERAQDLRERDDVMTEIDYAVEAWWKDRDYIKRLMDLLRECRSAIEQVPDKEVFGIGGVGMTHWYLADELVSNIDIAIGEGEGRYGTG